MILKIAWVIGSLLGLLAVGLGALGAHALKASLSVSQLASFETAVKYQFFHALALLSIFLAKDRLPHGLLNMAATLFFAGVLCFSGSIYLLATRDLLGIGQVKWLGPVTPVGGILMMLGWLVMMMAGLKSHTK